MTTIDLAKPIPELEKIVQKLRSLTQTLDINKQIEDYTELINKKKCITLNQQAN